MHLKANMEKALTDKASFHENPSNGYFLHFELNKPGRGLNNCLCIAFFSNVGNDDDDNDNDDGDHLRHHCCCCYLGDIFCKGWHKMICTGPYVNMK